MNSADAHMNRCECISIRTTESSSWLMLESSAFCTVGTSSGPSLLATEVVVESGSSGHSRVVMEAAVDGRGSWVSCIDVDISSWRSKIYMSACIIIQL